MQNLPKFVQHWLQKQQISGPIAIGLSGGIDSNVLLDLLLKVYPKDMIWAIYCNHGLQQEADKWQYFVKMTCQKKGIRFSTYSLHIKSCKNISIELAARQGRHKLWNQIIDNIPLFLAHHADDQLETMLMRIFRGTGIYGLVGIKERHKIDKLDICRPLLTISKQEIFEYAQTYHVRWIEDPSNKCTDMDRNYIRYEIIPKIKKRWHAVNQNAQRLASYCIEIRNFQNELTDEMFKEISEKNLSIKFLQKQPSNIQNILLRKWLKLITGYIPTYKWLKHLKKEVIYARCDRCPSLQLNNIVIRRFQNKLYITSQYDQQNNNCKKITIIWQGHHPIHLPCGYQLKAISNSPQEFRICYGYWGKKGKKIFQSMGVAPWLRPFYPTIWQQGKIKAILGLWEDQLP